VVNASTVVFALISASFPLIKNGTKINGHKIINETPKQTHATAAFESPWLFSSFADILISLPLGMISDSTVILISPALPNYFWFF